MLRGISNLELHLDNLLSATMSAMDISTTPAITNTPGAPLAGATSTAAAEGDDGINYYEGEGPELWGKLLAKLMKHPSAGKNDTYIYTMLF